MRTPPLHVLRNACGKGGHSIPEQMIRRRFAAGYRNFEQTYRHVVDDWALYDNAGRVPVLLAWGERS